MGEGSQLISNQAQFPAAGVFRESAENCARGGRAPWNLGLS
jgi:hypothetical protein